MESSDASSGGRPTRLAMVGLEHDHAWWVMKQILELPDATLVAIADGDASRQERARQAAPAGCRHFASTAAMLDDVRPDAVVATTAYHRHVEVLRECAPRGVHMYTHKPLATTAADAREMARLAQDAGITVMANCFTLWAAPMQEIFRRAQAGLIGPVYKFVSQSGHQGQRELGLSADYRAWHYDPLQHGGGALIDQGSYGITMAIWLMGLPTSVYAMTQWLKTQYFDETEDDFLLALEYPHGSAVIQGGYSWPTGRNDLQLYGPQGSLRVWEGTVLHKAAPAVKGVGTINGSPVDVAPVAARRRFGIAHFVDCLRRGAPIDEPHTPPFQVLVNEIVETAYESARRRCAVPFRRR